MGFESVYRLSVVMQMIDNLSQPMKSVGSKVDASISSLDRMSQGFGTISQTGAAMAGVGSQIMEGVMKPIEATFETKRAIGELASLGVQDLQVLENAAAQFSERWAGTDKADFITAAYDIKSGIASLTDQGVAQFTELSGITATATKSTVAEMTDLFATGYGIYKGFYSGLSDLEFGEMFSAGISESVKNFKTSGSGMAQAIKTLGASATSAQVPLEEQLSILGMLQATMSGSEAGTKYKAFLKSAAKGGEELGLDFLDANSQLLSMPEILEQLRGKFGETMDAAEKMQLQKAFGDAESVALIELLYNKTGDLQENIISLYGSMATGTAAATKMAEAINQTDPSQYELLKQKLHNLSEQAGNSLNPVLGEYMDKAGGVIEKAGEWIGSHQELVGKLMQVALVLGTLLTVAGTAAGVVGGVGLVFSRVAALGLGFGKMLLNLPGHLETLYIYALYAKDGLAKAGGVAGGFLKMIGTSGLSAIRSFGAALLANPVVLVIAGIAALIAAIVLLWNKCEWFRNLVKGVFAFMKASVFAGKEAFKAAFSAIGNVVGNVMSAARDTVRDKLDNIRQAYAENGGGIKGVAAAAVEAVKGYYTAGFDFMDRLTGGKLSGLLDIFSGGIQKVKDKITGAMDWFKRSGEKIITTFTDGIKNAIDKPVQAVKGGLQKIRDHLPFSDAKIGPLSRLTLSGRKVMTTFASGIVQEGELPSETVRKSFEGMDFSVVAKQQKPGMEKKEKKEGKHEPGSTGERKTVIERLVLNVDVKKIRDLQKLLQLMEEIEDYTNGNGPDMEPDPQPV